MTSQSMPARAITHSSSTRQCAPVAASMLYMRALAITPTSLDADLGAPHDLAPLRRLDLDHGGEFRRSVRDRLGTLAAKLLADVGLPQRLGDLRLQTRDDLARRPRGRDDAVPRSDIEARETRFRERRNLRRAGDSLQTSDTQRFELARAHVLQHSGRSREHELHLTAEHCGHRRGDATEWHVDHVRPDHALEQL